MILRIDHIGLATATPAALAPFLGALGLSQGDTGVAPEYRVACEFWDRADSGPAIELISPSGEGSTLDGRLSRTGPGLHHIAFEVDEIEPELERLRTAGFIPVDPEPRIGAREGMTVAFTYLRAAGLLVELVHYCRTN